MAKNNKSLNRRSFFKTVGAVGVGAVIASPSQADSNKPKTVDPNKPVKPQEPQLPQVPRRKLGKTGVKISALALGGGSDFRESQILLQKALDWGVTYWDTADCYGGGNSELGIGKFFEKNPEKRKEIFLVTKSDSRQPAGIQKLLDRSLERMKTDYIDLYFIHHLSKASELTDEIKVWAEKAKKSGKIKFFGFSTHGNMASCLMEASKLGWIDGIMTTYNFRVMQQPEMQAATEACYKAGVGLVAMKTQGGGQIETEEDKKLAGHFLKSGFTEQQAKIKIVLEDKRIQSVCSDMKSIAILTSNVAAVLDKTKLSWQDKDVLGNHAQLTCSGYCAGCAEICQRALPDMPYVSDIMRYLMYHNSYGEKEMAKQLFAKLPGNIRNRLLSTNYSLAEHYCPQGLPISKLIAEAVSSLSV